MSASQRTKGAAGEREWCDYLAEHGFPGAKRLLGQARDGGGDVPLPPMLYEVKRRKSAIAGRAWLDQAVKSVLNYKGVDIPAVAMREDGRPDWMVILRAEDFLKLLLRAEILK